MQALADASDSLYSFSSSLSLSSLALALCLCLSGGRASTLPPRPVLSHPGHHPPPVAHQLTAHSSARIALSHPVAPSGVIVSNSTALSHPGVHRRADHSYNNDGLASMATATFFLNQTGQTGAHVVHSVSSPTTHHSSLTTHHSPLTTRHSTLTTHYSPLRPAHTPVREQCGRRRPT